MFNHSLDQVPALTLSTKDYRWLHWKDWSDVETRFFGSERAKPHQNLFSQPPFFRHHDKPHLGLLSRWTLNSQNGAETPCGWVEIQVFWGGFTKGLLLYGFSQHTPNNEEALAYLISAAMLMGHFDLLTVAYAGETRVHKSTWGAEKQYYALAGDEVLIADKEPVSPMDVLVIDPGEWWKSELGARNRKALHYLETRLKRLEKKNGCACPK